MASLQKSKKQANESRYHDSAKTFRQMSGQNFLEKLLDGGRVEWLPLGEIVTLRRGRVMSKGYLIENTGDFPVYSSQTVNNGMIGKIDTFDFDGEYISWTTDGANAGTVFHRTGKFSITNVCGSIKINDESKLNYKFLFYWLSIEAQKYVYSGMGNPKLMSNQVEKIKIPIPCPDNPKKSLAIQAEIVRILDAFTELTSKLTTELTAELTARKKQYHYYRDSLLTFDEGKQTPFIKKLLDGADVEWLPLGDVADLYGGLTGKTKADFQSGDSKYVPYKNIFANIQVNFQELEDVNISGNEKQHAIKYGDVLFTGSSEIAEEAGISSAVTKNVDGNVYLNSFSFGLRFNEDICLIPEFSKYLFRSSFMRKEIAKTASGVTRFNVSKVRFRKIKIPIPCPDNPKKSLAIQAEIVRVLDKFDALTNSISLGLPREIELRNKQYQYYRDQLLNFPKHEGEEVR